MDTNDQQFRELMQNYRPQRAPIDFTKRVMDEIHQTEIVAEYKPIFGRWFLTIFGALFGGFILYASLNAGSGSSGSNPVAQWFSKVSQADSGLLDHVSRSLVGWLDQIPSIFIFALLAIVLLLVLDRFIQNQRKTAKA
ncbi:hypothetical protein [Mangrovibacterium lignilyticum]|uniref:hypothetical protein n=1 Tax=Mangrovibacterium lignilyticum TaxID=2668052 RepID=UPI0013D3661E|nr:hypothetical protein [Mangrovibacterium lignilyticum]